MSMLDKGSHAEELQLKDQPRTGQSLWWWCHAVSEQWHWVLCSRSRLQLWKQGMLAPILLQGSGLRKEYLIRPSGL